MPDQYRRHFTSPFPLTYPTLLAQSGLNERLRLNYRATVRPASKSLHTGRFGIQTQTGVQRISLTRFAADSKWQRITTQSRAESKGTERHPRPVIVSACQDYLPGPLSSSPRSDPHKPELTEGELVDGNAGMRRERAATTRSERTIASRTEGIDSIRQLYPRETSKNHPGA